MFLVQRCSPVQDIGKSSHSEGVPGVKLKAMTGMSKTKERAKKVAKKNIGVRREMGV